VLLGKKPFASFLCKEQFYGAFGVLSLVLSANEKPDSEAQGKSVSQRQAA